jgi:hypothetical protein
MSIIQWHGRQAIKTRYIPATAMRPSRVKAQCDAGAVILSWDDGANTSDNHIAACRALIAKVAWDDLQGTWHAGSIRGLTVAFVFVPFS